MQIYDSESRYLYFVDIYTLGQAAFSTPASDDVKTLARILESADTIKIFFDVRADSRALFKEFAIKLQGVKDVQHVELARRDNPRQRTFRPGLARLLNQWVASEERKDVADHKAKGRRLCARFGYELFSVRPLRRDLMLYAGNDVLHLQSLYSNLTRFLSEERLGSADVETNRRLLETHDPQYSPNETGARVEWPYEYEDDYYSDLEMWRDKKASLCSRRPIFNGAQPST
jgi:exonuclease 3'-5' domain-containing protein 1